MTRQEAERIANANESQGGGYIQGWDREKWIQQAMLNPSPGAPDDTGGTAAPAAPAAPEQPPQSPAMSALMGGGGDDPGAGWAPVGSSELNPRLGKVPPPQRASLMALAGGQMY